jgi:hypothetical protein
MQTVHQDSNPDICYDAWKAMSLKQGKKARDDKEIQDPA